VSTVAELAAAADVPPSALMRFCQIMGFSGFSEMQRLFREAYTPGLARLCHAVEEPEGQRRRQPAALLAEFVEAGRLSLEALAKSADEGR
jgi:DNA-binding MurR/RpiR family transcriptional regulator